MDRKPQKLLNQCKDHNCKQSPERIGLGVFVLRPNVKKITKPAMAGYFFAEVYRDVAS